jgi:molybdate transport system ATP-binding protein
MSIRAKFTLKKANLRLSVDLDIPSKGITVITGASGSGKTTLLRLLSGLEKADMGTVNIDGEDWQTDSFFLPTHKRDLGYVFQEDNLFPHLSVLQNLNYAKKRKDKTTSIDKLITLLGIEDIILSMPNEISGGERQRVAIARALDGHPKLILMDEPLSSLDQKRKDKILPYLEKIHHQINVPILYVSHSKEEILKLADYIIEMESGQIINQGPARDVINNIVSINSEPEDCMSVISAIIESHDNNYNLSYATFENQTLSIPISDDSVGSQVRVKVMAKDVSISLSRPKDTSVLNIFYGEITEIKEMDLNAQISIIVSGARIFSLISKKSLHLLGLQTNHMVYVQIKCMSLI